MVRRPRLAASLSVGLIAFVAGSLTLLPGVAFWDTAELQAVGPLMGTAHPTGFPTYVLVGWLASVVLQPFGEPAFLMNLLSTICVAVAAAVTVDLVRRLTGFLALGLAAGIGLALMPTAWAMATHAETHTLHLAFVAILLWLLVAWDDRVCGRECPRAASADRGDRYLVAAAAVFGLALGNHSLTLLLAIPVGLYVLAVDPGIWRRGRLVAACAGVLVLTVVLVYLELPLRAGPFRAPLVYGTPDTWEGFKYIVLAEQFRDSVDDPFGELPRKLGDLVTRTFTQFGILAPLIPIAFIATALRRPRYALLTGTAVAITCFFAASYTNADISRYYLGPALMAWTWLAILAAAAVELLAGLAGDPGDAAYGSSRPTSPTSPTRRRAIHRRRGPRDRRVRSGHHLDPDRGDRAGRRGRPPRADAPGAAAAPRSGRCQPPDRGRQLDRPRPRRDGARRRHRQLVELFDPAVVRPARRRPASGHRDHRRPDAARREPREPDRRDRRQPREAPGLRHPDRHERGQVARRTATTWSTSTVATPGR